jgi:hypothetical protein
VSSTEFLYTSPQEQIQEHDLRKAWAQETGPPSDIHLMNSKCSNMTCKEGNEGNNEISKMDYTYISAKFCPKYGWISGM